MKIGIAGYGYVGKAHEHVLKDYYDLIISDPEQGHYGDLKHADARWTAEGRPRIWTGEGHCQPCPPATSPRC